MIVQNKYELIEKIRSGGFSNIYKAIHIYKKRLVAIKFDHDEISKKLIQNEISIYLDIIKKPGSNFINIKSVGIINSRRFLVMEYIPQTIESYVDRSSYTLNPMEIFRDIVAIIKRLHTYKYVHRDLKPDNILVKNNRLILIDLGMATKISKRRLKNFIGNTLFSSCNTHLNDYEYTYEDDIRSCYYITFYLFSNKKLPWMNIHKPTQKDLFILKKNCKFLDFYQDFERLRDVICLYYKLPQ